LSGRDTAVAVVFVVEPSQATFLVPACPVEPVLEPVPFFLPEPCVEPAAVDVLFEPPEPPEPPVELAVPLPAGFAVELASAAGPLGCAEEADVSDGPSPRTPLPSLHAVSVSAASVIAVAARKRVRAVRAVRADMVIPLWMSLWVWLWVWVS
jgi:hypothetical protein